MRAKCFAVAHHKGGTGKTTSCINIAGELVRQGQKVLIVDMDPQASATSGLRINNKYLPFSIYDLLFDRASGQKEVAMKDVIMSTDLDNLHLAPADLDLAGALMCMQGAEDPTRILDQALSEVKHLYDYILIDTPPSYTYLLINAIVAADAIILPLEGGYFSLQSIETFNEILKDIECQLGVKKNIHTVILTKNNTSGLEKIHKKLEEKIPALGKIFPREDSLAELEERLRTYLSVGMGFNGNIFIVPYSKNIYAAQKKGRPLSHHPGPDEAKGVYRDIAGGMLGEAACF